MAYKSTVLGNAKYGNKEVLSADENDKVFADPDNPVNATQVTINDASTIIPDKYVPESDISSE